MLLAMMITIEYSKLCINLLSNSLSYFIQACHNLSVALSFILVLDWCQLVLLSGQVLSVVILNQQQWYAI